MKAVCYYGKKTCGSNGCRIRRSSTRATPSCKVTTTAICGSDLHLYDGFIPTMQQGDILGHEFMGEVVEVGRGSYGAAGGDRVVVPFTIACGRCYFCERDLCGRSATTPTPTPGWLEKLYRLLGLGLFGYSHLYGGYAGRAGGIRACALRRCRSDQRCPMR